MIEMFQVNPLSFMVGTVLITSIVVGGIVRIVRAFTERGVAERRKD